jgi:hypothetical protein
MNRFKIAAATALFVIAGAVPALAQSAYVKAGVLTCRTSATVGLLVGSRQRLSCQFRRDADGVVERYAGTMGRVGLDIGVTAGGVLAWGVFASTQGLPHGSLAGSYGGASGDAALGLGVGANVLVGGSRRSVSLQPLSVEGNVGIGLALGVAKLTLRSV